MKIEGTPALHAPNRTSRAAGRVAVATPQAGADEENVRLAGGARFISEVRAAVATISEVRALEVVRAQEDIASGALMTDAEVEAAVDGLLAGL